MSVDDQVREQLENLGSFIRSQRNQAQLSLRDLADKANVSNPYLSQIERGLHEPSMRILKAIASALNLSVETLLQRAGIYASGEDESIEINLTEQAIMADERLQEDQRASLLAVYRHYINN